MTKVVILSVPWCEAFPLVAPALLSKCLQQAGIDSAGLDLNIKFIQEFYNKPYWSNLKIFLSNGYVDKQLNYRRMIIDLFKFIKRELLAINLEHNPTHLGLSIFTNESINFSYLLIHYIRKYLPHVKIIVGGRGIESDCSLEKKPHYQKYFDHGLADLIVVGDAETAIIESIKSNHDGIYFSKKQNQQDLDNIPAPDWSHYNFSLYSTLTDEFAPADRLAATFNPQAISITASKGCVRKCTFCDVDNYWPNYIYRDGANVARDIITTYRTTGIKNFEFTDNLINGSISHYRKMNTILAETIPREIAYSGYAIFRQKESMPAEDFRLASLAGCEAWGVGVESGSETVRYHMRKKFNNDDLDFGVKQLHKNNIRQTWCLMVGYPTETEDDFKETLNLLRRYKNYNNNGMISLNITQPFQLNQNTPLMQEEEFTSTLNWAHEGDSNHHERFFWVTPGNPGNNFLSRYKRWHQLIDLSEELGYSYHMRMALLFSKWRDELESLKQIYEQSNKKIFFFSRA
jgi:radical SAM superfamily enzyme YgiQ (UPF0313 family)